MQSQGPSEGSLFTPDSVIWRVHRENFVLLAGSRALLLELAHPLVAAGVAQHSDFRRRPLRRLFNTLRVMQRLNFGSGQDAQTAARSIHRCHRQVSGVCDGIAYSANDPALRLWVWATLVDSTRVIYHHFGEPLNPDEQEAYYQDWKLMAGMMGIPASYLPENQAAFQGYMHSMIHDGALCVGHTALAVTHALFRYPALGPVLWLISLPGMTLLPPPIRTAYGFAWTERFEGLLHHVGRGFRRVRRFLPDMIAVQPDARRAERRGPF